MPCQPLQHSDLCQDRSDNQFSVKELCRAISGPKKDDWNKIYISLTEIIANFSDALDYKLFFAIPRDTSLTQNEMFLDNIKLVYEE